MSRTDPLVNTPGEDKMVTQLRALGADDYLRRALVGMATVGWTADEVHALVQGAAAGTVRPPAGPVVPQVQTAVITNADDLDARLWALNEAGTNPVIPFVDANGTASVAYGMAPSGDDWAVGLAAPREPDTGTEHCCRCSEHREVDCDAGATWQPRYPLTALIPPVQFDRRGGES